MAPAVRTTKLQTVAIASAAVLASLIGASVLAIFVGVAYATSSAFSWPEHLPQDEVAFRQLIADRVLVGAGRSRALASLAEIGLYNCRNMTDASVSKHSTGLTETRCERTRLGYITTHWVVVLSFVDNRVARISTHYGHEGPF